MKPRENAAWLNFAGHSKKYPNLPIALDGFGLHHLQEPIDRPGGMDFWQWIQCTEGCGTLILADASYQVPPGCGMLIPPGCSHMYRGNGCSWYVNFLCCGGALIQEITRQLGLTAAGAYQLSQPGRILQYEDEIAKIYQANGIGCHLALSKLLYQLLVDLSQDIRLSQAGQSAPQNEKLHQVICYIQEHFAENIGLTEIAASAGLSREYLCQIFKKHTGSTLLEHLTETRLSEAKVMLLAHPEKTIGEIARLCGFDSPSYFCYVFKKNEHMTPRQFAQGR